jgi:hypothetical protein
MKCKSQWFRGIRVWSTGVLASVVLAGVGNASAQAAMPLGALGASATAQAGYGTIKGRLVWGGAKVPERKVDAPKGQAPKDPQVCAKNAAILNDELVVDPASKGVANGFAYLFEPKGQNPEKTKAVLAKNPKVVLDQKNCTFIPHSLGLMQDQEVEFKSSDPTNHNLRYSAFTNAPFNQILPANGKIDKKLVAERRPIPVACDLHPWMKANLMVFNHPFFAVTGPDGSFEITGVPAGEQKLVVWQEKTGYVTTGGARGMAVQVKPGQTTEIELKLDPAKVR